MQHYPTKNIILTGLLLANSVAALAQDTIRLKNRSFEARRTYNGAVLHGWYGLGPDSESPPDIQPGIFKVDMPAQEGHNYVSLVVRENNTWEGIGQELSSFLQKDSVYSFSIHLAHSEQLLSGTKASRKCVNFAAPTILRIWGHNTVTKQDELLAETTNVNHPAWAKYIFTLQPTLSQYNRLDLIAYYAPGFEQQNGNLLLDNCSAIVKTGN